MSADCKRVEKNLVDIVENALPEHRARELRWHMESCSSCSLLVESFALIWKNLDRAEKIEPSSSFWIKLQQKISAHEERKFRLAHIFIGVRHILRPAALVFTLIAGIFAGYQIGNVPQDSNATKTEGKIGEPILGELITAPYLESFEDYHKGSITDFHLSSEIEKKE